MRQGSNPGHAFFAWLARVMRTCDHPAARGAVCQLGRVYVYTNIAIVRFSVYTEIMESRIIIWDEPKRQANIAKHHMDFADLTPGFFAAAVEYDAHSGRLAAIGPLQNGVITVIYIELGREALSVISMRPAKKKERLFYEQESL